MFKYPFHFDNNNNNKHRPPDLTVRVCAVSSLGDRRGQDRLRTRFFISSLVFHTAELIFITIFIFCNVVCMYTHAKKEEDAHQFFNK